MTRTKYLHVVCVHIHNGFTKHEKVDKIISVEDLAEWRKELKEKHNGDDVFFTIRYDQ